MAWINLREWVKRKKDAAVARYRAYRERVSKIEHAPQPPERPETPREAPEAPAPTPPASIAPFVQKDRRPCDAVYTPEQVSEMKDRILSRGYDADRVSQMMERPVSGWCGWVLASEFDAEFPGVDCQEIRDPEGRLLKRFAQ